MRRRASHELSALLQFVYRACLHIGVEDVVLQVNAKIQMIEVAKAEAILHLLYSRSLTQAALY
jgi:hypothetical protein